jgi:hypothetical protein
MGNRSNGLIMSQARDRAAIYNFEDGSQGSLYAKVTVGRNPVARAFEASYSIRREAHGGNSPRRDFQPFSELLFRDAIGLREVRNPFLKN